ncbi:MAG: hypothetical protein WDO18_11780 [Acidobacteriota bacterium]
MNVDDYIAAAIEAFYSRTADDWRALLDRALTLKLNMAERGAVLSYKAQYTFHLSGYTDEVRELAEESLALLEESAEDPFSWALSAGLVAHLVRETDPERAARLRTGVVGFVEEYVASEDAVPGWVLTLCRAAALCCRDTRDFAAAAKWLQRGLPENVGTEHADVIVALAGDLDALQRYDEAEDLLLNMEACLACIVPPPANRYWEHEVQMGRAIVVANRGEYEKAREILETLVANQPRVTFTIGRACFT